MHIFFKYDRNRILLNYNKYEKENYILYPTAFEETNSCYRIFCDLGMPNSKSKVSFVQEVLNIDKEENLVELIINFNITESNKNELSFFKSSVIAPFGFPCP